jgi:hypothetical protein
MELIPYLSPSIDSTRPTDDQGNVDTSLVNVLLVPLEGRIAGLRPSPGIVGVAVRPADLVDAGNRLIRSLDHEVEELHLVQDAERSAFLARSIVCEEHEDRVVGHSKVLEPRSQTSDLVVRVVQECSERLLKTARQPLLIVGQRVPRLDTGVPRREFRLWWNHSEPLLILEPALSDDVPALVECSSILVEIATRRLMGSMRRSESEIHEERTIGTDRKGIVHEADRLVDKVLGEVIAVLRACWRIDEVIVVDQFGVELIGLSVEETVVAIETPLKRPLVVGARC